MTYKPGGPTNRENNPGHAKWCEEHHRLECVKNKSRDRGLCHAVAIRGTDTCRLHSGARLEVAKIKGEARITAWSAMGKPAGGKSIDAGMAVLGMLHQSWLRAAAYGEMLRQQVTELGEAAGVEPDPSKTTHGLIGWRYGAAGKEGNIFAVGEEIRGLVSLEAAERDRVVRFAKVAHDMGISSRLTSLAERWSDVVITRIMRVMEGLELTPEQEAKVAGLIGEHLGRIDIGMTE